MEVNKPMNTWQKLAYRLSGQESADLIRMIETEREQKGQLSRENRGLTNQLAELQSPTPKYAPPPGGKFGEYGAPGILHLGDFISSSYVVELRWPQVIPIYSRIWQTDPEVALARLIMATLSRRMSIGVDLPQNTGENDLGDPTDDDQKAQQYLYEVLDDIEGGIGNWLNSCITQVPLYGWGWWEVVPGLRKEGWVPPEDEPWRSSYDDGLIGVRKLAFRDYSSFFGWDMNQRTGRVYGLRQFAVPNPPIIIPANRSVHIRYGNVDNPEGLGTMMALYRLERIKYALEMIQGIGYEHSAGYLQVETDVTQFTDEDKRMVRDAARSILSAQEGSYALWPKGFTGKLVDGGFRAAQTILETVRYYGILKLALLGLQWAALGTMSPYGSRATITDASAFFVQLYNSMAEGFIEQLDQQLGKRLFENPMVRSRFPNMTRRPRIVLTQKIHKQADLQSLGQFLQALESIMPLGQEDLIAIRGMSDFLPETLPEDPIVGPGSPQDQLQQQMQVAKINGAGMGAVKAPKKPGAGKKKVTNFKGGGDITSTQGGTSRDQVIGSPKNADDPPNPAQDDNGQSNFARPLNVDDDELPMDVEHIASISEQDIAGVVKKFKRWAAKKDPRLSALLDAQVAAPEPPRELAQPQENVPQGDNIVVLQPQITVNVPEQTAPNVNVTNNVPVPEVNVSNNVPVPDVKVDVAATEVNVAAPDVTVNVPEGPAPSVTVQVPEQPAPTVNVQVPKQNAPVVQVNVPEQPAPTVNVHVPEQTPPDVNVEVKPPARKRNVKVQRDMNGRISGLTEE